MAHIQFQPWKVEMGFLELAILGFLDSASLSNMEECSRINLVPSHVHAPHMHVHLHTCKTSSHTEKGE